MRVLDDPILVGAGGCFRVNLIIRMPAAFLKCVCKSFVADNQLLFGFDIYFVREKYIHINRLQYCSYSPL